MTGVNWNNYREQFPTRYWQLGRFDVKLNTCLETLYPFCQFKTAVDIGGGTVGTTALKEFAQQHNIPVDLLDPFVDEKPDWIRSKIDWSSNEKFDLLVSRGSINYLTVEQLSTLKRMMTKSSFFIANTFLNPPPVEWSEREVVNAAGEKGLERSRLGDTIVEHQIIFPSYTVEHQFFYYTEADYRKIFDQPTLIPYGQNSFLLVVKNIR